MSRQRLSEFRAKQLLAATLSRPYPGLELDAETEWRSRVAGLSRTERYVVKVDQAVKARFKQGLVALDIPHARVAAAADELFARGFRYCLVEPYMSHDSADERYLAIRRLRAADTVLFSVHGGVDINDQTSAVTKSEFTPASAIGAEHALGLAAGTLERLHSLFNDSHLTLLELNPLLVMGHELIALDAAAEVDATAEQLVAGRWTAADLRRPALSPEEAAVEQLSAHSPASFNLKPLNPHGQIFVLLSGGGASLVVTDEFCHQGFGPQLGNYGEYSGDPSESEVVSYVRQVLALLKKSPTQAKILVIGGGVANFTDVRTTFKGIIRALAEEQAELQRAGVKVYVRRGGPHAEEGLTLMREFLKQAGLFGLVAGPELGLPELVTAATAHLTSAATL
jgi:succinyl-CoA synthetase beta subunit